VAVVSIKVVEPRRGEPVTVLLRSGHMVDMRNGIDGLRAMVERVLKRDPYSGHPFVFVGKSRDKVKILFWDRNGFVLDMKRREQGRFQLPAVSVGKAHSATRMARAMWRSLCMVVEATLNDWNRAAIPTANRPAAARVSNREKARGRCTRGVGFM
jgi:transposase